MTPAARVQAAIEIVDLWQAGGDGLDRVLLAWGRSNRFAGSGDRRAIADLVHDAVRRLRSAAWVAGADETPSGRDILRGSLMLDGLDPAEMFTGIGHAPAPLSGQECGSPRDLARAPRAIRLDYSDDLESHFEGVPDAVLSALGQRAPVDLRANLLKCTAEAAVRALAEDGIVAEPLARVDTALRVVEGARRIKSSSAFRDGLVEIQDVSSQVIADLGAARSGETVLDLCAGGGGKALALAARMGGGAVLAHDISSRRMSDLPARAVRAGAEIRQIATPDLAGLAGRCDLVFVDAPCSGSGAWRRNPDAKWRLTGDELVRLTQLQSDLLDQAAELAAPDGRVVYATCSLLDVENNAQVEAFLQRRQDWFLQEAMSLTPLEEGDGFFGARLARKMDSSKN